MPRLTMAARRSQKLTLWWKDRVVPTAGAVTLLAGVATLAWQFSNANDKARLESQQRDDAFNLDKTRKAYEDEIAQIKSQFELLPRQAGEQRLFDLNTLAITPDQARQLPESYFPYELDDMRLYLSLPKASDWSYIRTTEEDFAPLLYEQRGDYKQPRSWSGEERYLHDLAKNRRYCCGNIITPQRILTLLLPKAV